MRLKMKKKEGKKNTNEIFKKKIQEKEMKEKEIMIR